MEQLITRVKSGDAEVYHFQFVPVMRKQYSTAHNWLEWETSGFSSCSFILDGNPNRQPDSCKGTGANHVDEGT